MDKDRIEQGIFQFSMGATKFNQANEMYHYLVQTKEHKEKYKTTNDIIKRDVDRQSCMDNIARGIDLMLKGLVYIYTDEDIPEKDHRIRSNITILTQQYGNYPELYKLDSTLQELNDKGRLVHAFISNCNYTKISIKTSTLDTLYECGESLQVFGTKANLFDYDEFMATVK